MLKEVPDCRANVLIIPIFGKERTINIRTITGVSGQDRECPSAALSLINDVGLSLFVGHSLRRRAPLLFVIKMRGRVGP